ncbi:hypothetical protein HK096_001289 [Nowakowskiella sp. JEL0078]|nr:hypothetical protein HK096_001289 [Nowakowskiella sp. JEL0078]
MLRTSLRLQWLLLLRNPRLAIVTVIVPIVMISAAAGMSKGINNSLRTIPTDFKGYPILLEQALPFKTQGIAAVVPDSIRSDPFFSVFSSYFSNVLKYQFLSRTSSNVPVNNFASFKDVQSSNVLNDKYNSWLNASNTPFYSAMYRLDKPFGNVTSSDGKVDLKFDVGYDSNSSVTAISAMVSIVGSAASAKFSRLSSLSQGFVDTPVTLPYVGTFPNPVRVDVGAGLVPAFMANGAVMFLSFKAVPQVRDREQGFLDLLVISGMTPLSYYLGVFIIDLFSYYLSMTCAFLVVVAFQFPYFVGTNPLAFILPLLFFGPVIILMAYTASFFFKKESSVGPLLGMGSSIIQ